MASYTMLLRTYIEMWSQNEKDLSIRERIEIGRKKLFDFDYPFYVDDPQEKKEFETRFIRHFYMKEIGFETEGLFKFHLETWLITNMEYYNKLYESSLLEYNPLENFRVTTKREIENKMLRKDVRDTTQNSSVKDSGTFSNDGSSTGKNTSKGSNTNDSFNRNLKSDTPDGRLGITTKDGQGVIEYASNINEDVETGKGTSTSTNDGTASNKQSGKSSNSGTGEVKGKDNLNSNVDNNQDLKEEKYGKIGTQSYATMLQEYRNALLRVDKLLFDEIKVLFMLIY